MTQKKHPLRFLAPQMAAQWGDKQKKHANKKLNKYGSSLVVVAEGMIMAY
ncbi:MULTISPECIES: hypothetical protein [Symbiopectobacterium]|nr:MULTISPECIES: hypothetical protein [Symbiopectobacterium]MBT9430308.1 hypothetical protein [Candidatus Symbiopectobacterium endolongispinus]